MSENEPKKKDGEGTPTPENPKQDSKPKPKDDSKGNPKGTKPKRKGNKNNRKGDKGDKDEKPKSFRGNDVSWYTKYPNLVIGTSSHIFNVPMGGKYRPFSPVNVTNEKVYGHGEAIPGVVALLWKPWYSTAGTDADAVNVAAKNLYSYVRHANSGSVNYESSDLMEYIIQTMSLFAYAAQLKRDLKLIFTYKATNKYMYQRVLWTCGYTMTDIQDMINNYPLYQSRLNRVIAQLNTFKIPKEMTVLARHLWLSSHIWKDDELDKATVYAYVQQGFYKYDWSNGVLEFNNLLADLSSTASFTVRLTALESEINYLLGIEDIGIMIGDMLKAYGNDACYMQEPLPLGETYEAEYSAEVVSQIQNTVVVGTGFTVQIKQVNANSQLLYEGTYRGTGASAVNTFNGSPISTSSTPTTNTMAPGRYYYHVKFDGSAPRLAAFANLDINPFLVCNSDNPKNEEIIVNTRLTVAQKSSGLYDTDDQNQLVYFVDSNGSELVVDSVIITSETQIDQNGETERYMGGHIHSYKIFDIANPNVNDDTVHLMSQIYKVDRFPQFVILTPGTSANSYRCYMSQFYYGKNTIIAETAWLSALHDACKLSEFTIPMFRLLESKR